MVKTYRNDAVRSDSIQQLRESLGDLELELADATSAGHVHYASNIRNDIRWCKDAIAKLEAKPAAR